MPTRVKICGITCVEDATLAVELGAAALGFNFYPASPRHIAPSAARVIISKLPPLVTAVGVFANETDGAHVAAIALEAGVTTVQLHGTASPLPGKGAKALDGFTVFQAIAVWKGFKPEILQHFKANAFLLDAYDPGLHGGTGKTFDWYLAREARKFGTIIIAGGLTAENVGQAIREVLPYAVDVASGVESAPGIKDPAKLRAFFAEVAKADNGH
ncbi:MAG TPA: phosphoribosylanthranilate isomerase [Terriglobia bacterium]|nr:phosphoribosylanthranilate isomerase [Terriglobia bacterium]